MRQSIILAVTAFLLTAPDSAAASALFDEGVDHFKAGRYHLSSRALSAAAARDPASQLVRYYLACASVKLGDHRKAIEEYRIAYLLDPASATGEYCAKALAGYRAALPHPAEAQRLKEALQQKQNQVPVAVSAEMQKAISVIRQQADGEKSKHQLEQSRREKVVRGVAEEQLRAIDQQMQDQIARLSDPLIFTPEPRANPLLIYPELLKQKEDAIRKAAQEEKERVLRNLDQKTEQFKGLQKVRDAALDEVAANLESQMANNAGSSSVRLQPAGTGLYVRNYLPAGAKAPAEVRPAIVRIVPEGGMKQRGSFNSPGDGAGQDPGQLPPVEASGPRKAVNGRILPSN